ncbi:cold, circadian rhythm, and rna binding 2 [Actinidia rufa]|uniref:Cold, circadian rhythm, and rna binding 2 n=1 Tax=Actinidia rufa TaxID=165716 RepID=A0A7J0GPV4_9ERIC|nr:cold, circadian rhythm, and rna binding 2 [Actinidia rufa]
MDCMGEREGIEEWPDERHEAKAPRSASFVVVDDLRFDDFTELSEGPLARLVVNGPSEPSDEASRGFVVTRLTSDTSDRCSRHSPEPPHAMLSLPEPPTGFPDVHWTSDRVRIWALLLRGKCLWTVSHAYLRLSLRGVLLRL